jgi:hypothetical protein
MMSAIAAVRAFTNVSFTRNDEMDASLCPTHGWRATSSVVQ